MKDLVLKVPKLKFLAALQPEEEKIFGVKESEVVAVLRNMYTAIVDNNNNRENNKNNEV